VGGTAGDIIDDEGKLVPCPASSVSAVAGVCVMVGAGVGVGVGISVEPRVAPVIFTLFH
jgi:hypothetical protein